MNYRNSNEKNIVGLIKSDTLNRFLSFGSSLFGVTGVHDEYLNCKFKGLYGSWHITLNSRYQNNSININQFIDSEAKRTKANIKVIEANLQRRLDEGFITISPKGLLLFQQTKTYKKRGRPKLNLENQNEN